MLHLLGCAQTILGFTTAAPMVVDELSSIYMVMRSLLNFVALMCIIRSKKENRFDRDSQGIQLSRGFQFTSDLLERLVENDPYFITFLTTIYQSFDNLGAQSPSISLNRRQEKLRFWLVFWALPKPSQSDSDPSGKLQKRFCSQVKVNPRLFHLKPIDVGSGLVRALGKGVTALVGGAGLLDGKDPTPGLTIQVLRASLFDLLSSEGSKRESFTTA
ncbi:hypothetical protein M9H77_23577 [Catharanthus roseus]|uniref:Uncharacterized protein n=1 Tax=Catharanthus roseus TaxID=4058 RepID=A0ACC0ATN2_CATRO|nr:hypothetical protein M9H77_23577 [Catharanthus roseus]